jgi:hypothetical protein
MEAADKTTTPGTEIQLGFAFFNEISPVSIVHPENVTHGRQRSHRAETKPKGLADSVAAAQAVLLAAPLSDVDAQLLPLLEFCEAALTRALDAVATRSAEPFSTEEYRSLRGIGQAQWLLAETQASSERKLTVSREQKQKNRKKMRKR